VEAQGDVVESNGGIVDRVVRHRAGATN